MGDMFVEPLELQQTNALDERTRFFTVEKPEYLVTPGLTSLEAVLIGGQRFHVVDTRSFAVMPPGREVTMEETEVPLFALNAVPGVGEIVQRSQYSNHGLWQVGMRVGIVGDWAEGEAEEFVSSIDVSAEIAKRDANIAAMKAENDKLKSELSEAKKSPATPVTPPPIQQPTQVKGKGRRGRANKS